jgi:GT2 family glycosyltransferase
VLFLNNDIAMTDPRWLHTIQQALEPGVLVGAELRYDDHADVDGQKLPYLDGWCLAGMADDLIEIGGFDETFAEPSYFGDNDLCLRARSAGIGLREVRVGLRHKLNQTAGRNAFVQAVSLANRERYIARVRELLAAA